MIMSASARAGLALLTSLALGVGSAQAADILPVATPSAPLGGFPYTVKSPSPVTLAIFQGGVDKTASWLPEPGQAVQLVVKVNGVIQSPAPSMTLVDSGPSGPFDGLSNPFLNASRLTTSRYPGQCTNTDNPAPPQDAADYTLTGNTLTPTDCGGFAVIEVTVSSQGTFKFIVPQDGNSNGIPDLWEAQFCNTVPCPTGAEDNDRRPTTSTLPLGDNAGALDEYRGYMVAGVHVRTDPRQMDLFIFLVNPQCHSDPSGVPSDAARELSRLGGGTLTFPTPGNGGLFDGLFGLYGQTQIHQMHGPGANYASTEFINRFKKYTVSSGQRYLDTDGVETGTPPADDRRINKNAVLSGNQVQKLVRVIECIAPPPPATPLGLAGTISVDSSGYAILYTHRIISNICGLSNPSLVLPCAGTSLVGVGAGRKLRFSTYQAGRATSPTQVGDGDPNGEANVNYLISQAMKFYAAHEVLHTGNLVPPGGTHDAVGTGHFLDSAILTKVDNKTTGFNTFYVPTLPDSMTSLYKSDYRVE
jgi:hypothetical protein